VSYEVPRSTRIAGIATGALIVCSFVAYGERYAIKEKYFNAVLSSCANWHNIRNVRWEFVPAFDAEVRDFRGHNESQIETIRCVDRWAGLIIDDVKDIDYNSTPRFRGEALQTAVSGQMLATRPPQRFFDVSHIVYVAAETSQKVQNAQTH
jgi:hypothetical protein